MNSQWNLGRKRHRWCQLVMATSSIYTWSQTSFCLLKKLWENQQEIQGCIWYRWLWLDHHTPSIMTIMSTRILSSINSPTIWLAQLTWALIVSLLQELTGTPSALVTHSHLAIICQQSVNNLSTNIETPLFWNLLLKLCHLLQKPDMICFCTILSCVHSHRQLFWPASHDSIWIQGNTEWFSCVK